MGHVEDPVAALEGERGGVFHIALATDYDAARAAGQYAPPSLRDEGFIHCSLRTQVADTAARFYAGRDDLWLLRIDAVALRAQLRYEGPSPPAPDLSGVLFPHLYGPLPLSAVRGAARLTFDDEGALRWPTDPAFA